MTATHVGLSIRLRSLLFFVLYNLLGILHGSLSLLLAPLMNFEQRYRFVNLWTHLSMWLLRHLNGIRIEVIGRENLPRDQAVVVMANHQSEWETFFLQVLVSPQATVLKRELLQVPFFGWAVSLLRPIAIDRSKPVHAMKMLLRQGKERLDAGVSVVIYPEGTRQPPGCIGPFNPGGARLACHAGRRVVPMVHNAGDCWPARSIWRIPGTIRLVIGEPMGCEGGAEELKSRVERWMRETSVSLRAGGFSDSPA
ncbi:lysophospholipid acyltransferase family protein [Imhoffiella purpurea]|uniref:1-acyl-sn-glycerol-3-phosphate acyltransferase n=1 Tax=Imhoffiella purpurea TaxID=1249627 RepID=W9V8W6_9GAMM|nr:lysophospholipid acyltransferase family protein [Imhoffiella purpurea]EXJ15854.1 1-acyl-sn-glycerol-3-phosphate acyltransferase [Imhoffiella purpurea]